MCLSRVCASVCVSCVSGRAGVCSINFQKYARETVIQTESPTYKLIHGDQDDTKKSRPPPRPFFDKESEPVPEFPKPKPAAAKPPQPAAQQPAAQQPGDQPAAPMSPPLWCFPLVVVVLVLLLLASPSPSFTLCMFPPIPHHSLHYMYAPLRAASWERSRTALFQSLSRYREKILARMQVRSG